MLSLLDTAVISLFPEYRPLYFILGNWPNSYYSEQRMDGPQRPASRYIPLLATPRLIGAASFGLTYLLLSGVDVTWVGWWSLLLSLSPSQVYSVISFGHTYPSHLARLVETILTLLGRLSADILGSGAHLCNPISSLPR